MNSATKSIISYSYPKMYSGKEIFVAFTAYDPALGKMRRKKIKLNHIAKSSERRKFANDLILRLSEKLRQGWNPWIEADDNMAYHCFDDVMDRYHDYLLKMYDDDNLRKETIDGYLSKLRVMKSFNADRKLPIIYIYQFDRNFVVDFLDYVYMDLGNTPRTRNNYLNWLSSLGSWLQQHQYKKDRITAGITCFKRCGRDKDRTVISDVDMRRLHDYLVTRNKHYLLACYILHYVLIRPREMSYLQLKDFHLKNQTIFISGKFSKNRKNAVVTLPAKVIHLMVELNVFDSPDTYYLFSENFRPGKERRSEKTFRDYWTRRIRKDLHFGEKYKFYSLKDTGITNMLRTCDVVTVRDQARHSSILITDIYTPADIKEANQMLLNYEGVL